MKKALKAFNALRAEYLNLPECHWTERDPIAIIGVSNNLLEKLQEFAIRDYRHAIPRKTWDKFFKMIVDDLTRYSTRGY